MPVDFTILKNKFSPQYLRIFYYYFRVRYKISKFILILKKFYCRIDQWQVNIYAEVAQLVERLPSKQAVASSSLVFRSIKKSRKCDSFLLDFVKYLCYTYSHIKRYRLVVRTGDSHSPNRGSIPLTAGYFLCIKSNQKHFRHIGL